MLLMFPWLSILVDRTAYLDPGSGSVLVQLAIAGLMAMAILVRSQWSKIKKLFSRKYPKPEEKETEDDDQ